MLTDKLKQCSEYYYLFYLFIECRLTNRDLNIALFDTNNIIILFIEC